MPAMVGDSNIPDSMQPVEKAMALSQICICNIRNLFYVISGCGYLKFLDLSA